MNQKLETIVGSMSDGVENAKLFKQYENGILN